jgi:hypothetical protein
MIWRWDQGRLSYFEFDILKKIAKALYSCNGSDIGFSKDLIRIPLESATNMPFAPSSYTVWRNYKRVFECAFLATKINNRLIITDLCDELCKDDGMINDADDYFSFYIPRFRFPFPAFQEYNHLDKQIYPFCAILKYLTAKKHISPYPSITLDEVFSIIIANECTGLESIEHYLKIKPLKFNIISDQKRQIREMLIFISQISVLKWFNNSLYLDISSDDIESNIFQKLLNPVVINPDKIKEQDLLNITRTKGQIVIPGKLRSIEDISDQIFVEGKRSRVTHLKIERSPLLRKNYREKYPLPICQMCEENMTSVYPWTKYLIEMHHVLPLSAGLSISLKGTSIKDLIGVCPSCHKSIHLFYKLWLDKQKKDDFNDKEEAREVYLLAKNKIAI